MEAEATSPASSADEPADGLRTSAMAMAASNSRARARARARLPDNCEDDRVLARSGPHESDPTAKRVAGWTLFEIPSSPVVAGTPPWLTGELPDPGTWLPTSPHMFRMQAGC